MPVKNACKIFKIKREMGDSEMKDLEEELVESSRKFSGSVLSVRVDRIKLPDGESSIREIVDHPGGVTILPVNRQDEVIMIEQYRHAAEEVLLELPAGRLEESEEAEKAARRELKEETGYTAEDLKHFFDFYTTPGYSTECLHLYLARGLKEGEQELEEGEFLSLREVPLEDIPEMIMAGSIKDSKTLIGLLTYLQQYSGQETD